MSGIERRMLLRDGARVAVEWLAQGDGPPVVLLPSLGRDSEDLEHLAGCLAAAGWRALRPTPRGIGASQGPLEDITLHHLAADVIAVIEDEARGPAVIAGHAFGNWVARVAAVDRPDLVRAVIVLAAGPRRVRPEAAAGLDPCMDASLPIAERLGWLRRTFFAPGSDASVWLDGWHPAVSRAWRAAKARTPVDEWWSAGGVPMLDVRAGDDAFVAPDDRWSLQVELGDRVASVTVADAGHALLPEQPEAVAESVLGYLRRFAHR